MGKAVKSNSCNLILLAQTRSTTQRSILLCLFPSSQWEMKYPPTKCHSLRLVILFPVRQGASDTLQVRPVIRSWLYWQSKRCPHPSPLALAVMLCYSCLLGYLLLRDPASCSCCFHPSLPIRIFFSVAIFGLSEKNHIYEENNWRQHSLVVYI